MIDISESVMQFLLAFLVAAPLLGAAAALLPAPPGLKGKSPDQAVLRHGVTGFVVEDFEEAVRAVGRVGELDRAACRQEFLDRFADSRMAHDYTSLYQKLLKPMTAA